MGSSKKARKNSGKRFEGDIVSSVPSDVLVHRLNDSAQAYNGSANTSFCWNNKCDFYLYRKPMFLAVECKSTKYKSMSVQLSKDDSGTSMIKHHQVEALKELSRYDGVVAGFLFNFRHFEGEENEIEITYFQSIEDFLDMIENTGKKSFNEIDLICCGNAIKVPGRLKRTHYAWDIEHLLDVLNDKYICI